MGEEAKIFWGGIAEKTDGSSFGDINRFWQLKHHWSILRGNNYSHKPYLPYSKNKMFIISDRFTIVEIISFKI